MPEQPQAPNLLIRPDQVVPFDRGNGVVTIPYVEVELRDQPRHHGQTQFAPGTGLPLHSHNVEESVLILEGEAVAEIGEERFDLVAGEATWVPPGSRTGSTTGVPARCGSTGSTAAATSPAPSPRPARPSSTSREATAVGERVAGAVLPAVVTTVNPVDGSLLAEYPRDPADVEAALEATADAARAWRSVPVARRVELLRALADHLRAQTERYAALVTAEMGKPLAEARGEVAKSALTADWYAASSAARCWRRGGRDRLSHRRLRVRHARAVGGRARRHALDFPVWQVMRAAIPTVAAGNALLLKHAPNVTGSALLLQQAFVDAGFPEGLVTTLVVAEPDDAGNGRGPGRGSPRRRGHAHR